MREELHWLPNHNHSFIPAISIAPLQVLYHLEALPLQHRYCIGVSRRSAQATAGKGLTQGPYVTAGVEPTTLRFKVIDSTKEPSRPTIVLSLTYYGCDNIANWFYNSSYVRLVN